MAKRRKRKTPRQRRLSVASKRRKRLSQRTANTLLTKLRKGGPDAVSDHELGKLILRTNRKTKKTVLRILRVDGV